MVRKQLEAVLSDIRPDVVKTGMLANADVIRAVASSLSAARRIPLVVDPVMLSKSGDALLDQDSAVTLRELLFPLADLITPNIPEAEVLTGKSTLQRRRFPGSSSPPSLDGRPRRLAERRASSKAPDRSRFGTQRSDRSSLRRSASSTPSVAPGSTLPTHTAQVARWLRRLPPASRKGWSFIQLFCKLAPTSPKLWKRDLSSARESARCITFTTGGRGIGKRCCTVRGCVVVALQQEQAWTILEQTPCAKGAPSPLSKGTKTSSWSADARSSSPRKTVVVPRMRCRSTTDKKTCRP